MNNNEKNNGIMNNYNNSINNGFSNQMQNNNQTLHSDNNTNYSNNYSTNTINNNKKNTNLKKLILIVVAIIIIVVIAFFIYNKFSSKSSENIDINYSTSFFIQNNDNKYALFSDDGKKLTDFIYTSASNFVNGTAIVQQDDKVGIISANGKMTVDFGKYSYITSAAGMYEVHGGDYHYYLIDGSGKTLYDMENVDLDTFIGANTYSILEDEKNSTYSVLNYNGKSMVSFPIVKDTKDPSTNEEDGYISVFYNGKNFILNVHTGKEIVSFNADKHYCVNKVQRDGKLISLNSCVSWYESQDEITYKIIDNGKVIDIDQECNSVFFNDDMLVCRADYKDYLLDNNYKKSIEVSSSAYNSESSYVKNKNGSFEGVDFYSNGSIVKNVACRTLKETGYMSNGIYILRTYFSETCGTESGTYEFYKSNGEKAFDKSFSYAEKFDKNGYAKISEDKTNYYLIDSSGKQIGGLYSSISLSNDYYIVTKSEKKGIMDKNGKEVVPCEYSRIDISNKQNKIYATLTSSDSKNIVYDIDNSKEILTTDKSISLHDHYIYVANNSTKQYYSYTTGKMFYEE